MIKVALVGWVLLASSMAIAATGKAKLVARFPAQAPKYEAWVEECQKSALEKLRSIAEINGYELDESTVRVSSVDDRWYNPSKYVWFMALAKKNGGLYEPFEVLTQKSFLPLKSCF